MDFPQKLKSKKAIINVQNRDNGCLKRALKAALYPAPKGKNANRPSSYPVVDGLNYTGIDFPTPVKQIDKVPRINLMLIESGEKKHYCYVKRVSALLFDQSKISNAKHCCMMCLTGLSREDFLENHKKILQWCEWQANKD